MLKNEILKKQTKNKILICKKLRIIKNTKIYITKSSLLKTCKSLKL